MKQNTKILLLLILGVFAIVVFSQPIHAQGFGVGAVICDYYWVCTEWSGDNCGTRTCLDLTGCNHTIGKPNETLACYIPPTESTSSSEGGGSSGGSFSGSSSATRRGDFSLSRSLVELSVRRNTYSTSRLELISNENLSYELRITPDDGFLTADNEFEAFYSKSKIITFKINSSGKAPGIYTYKVVIKNEFSEKEIFIVVEVTEDDLDLNFKLNLPGEERLLKKGGTIRPEIIFNKELTESVVVTYSLINNLGERIILKSEKTTQTRYNPYLNFPEYVPQGYTVLEVKVESKNNEVSKYVVLLSDPNDEYAHIEEPKEIIDEKRLEYTLMAMAFAAIIIMGISIFSGYRKKKIAEKQKTQKSVGKTEKENSENSDKKNNSDEL